MVLRIYCFGNLFDVDFVGVGGESLVTDDGSQGRLGCDGFDQRFGDVGGEEDDRVLCSMLAVVDEEHLATVDLLRLNRQPQIDTPIQQHLEQQVFPSPIRLDVIDQEPTGKHD